jgi:DNA-binding response OmpR family regulator
MKTGAAWLESPSPSRLSVHKGPKRTRNSNGSPTAIAAPGTLHSSAADARPSRRSGRDLREAEEANSIIPTGAPFPATVLLVSEDDYFRTTMRAYLEHVGCRVRCCAHVAWLPNLFFQGARIDLLLMDVDLLGTPGLRVADELTAFAPDLPVIVISSPSAALRDFAGANQRGWGILRKPVVLPELLGTIRRVLETEAMAGRTAAPVDPPGEADPRACLPAQVDGRGRMAPQEAKISCQTKAATGTHR